MTTYEALQSKVSSTPGPYLTTMEELKLAHGATKLGVNIRAAIADRLKSYGIGHLPTDLPQYQWDEVRLYPLGTALEKVIKAVIEPSERGDQVLLQVVDTDAQKVLAQIRELVCG
ncbi:hypothetical protein NJB1507_08510 [Mycobacterium marinum]|uniref:hypothetical protein n=1 Tax=Mycobacterium marinum TaxID=1781 RepID=UPI0021C42F6D|nr:hypothetical protein [Mycobacterium marinum]GJO17898.1 hypothetical protein NJB1507_08510 [Mycobacterium marinum]